jgi:competence protein ComEA
MNLPVPIVLSVVAVAAGVAVVRATHPASVPPLPSFADVSHDAAASNDAAASGNTALAEPPSPARSHAPSADVVVYVAGAVAHRGVYHLPVASRAVDALHAAGGATNEADLVAVNLAAPLADGDEVVVPEKGTVDDASVSDASAPAHPKRKHKRHRKKHHKRHHRAAPADPAAVSEVADPANSADDSSTIVDAAPAAPVDLNTAGQSELETLPGIGAGLAERIVTFRELNGPFVAPDDLLDVGGMTEKRLEVIEPFLTI